MGNFTKERRIAFVICTVMMLQFPLTFLGSHIIDDTLSIATAGLIGGSLLCCFTLTLAFRKKARFYEFGIYLLTMLGILFLLFYLYALELDNAAQHHR